MDVAPNIPAFRTMLEGNGFNISADTAVSNQEGINQFSELKALTNDRKGTSQAKYLITVVRKPSVGKDGNVINTRDQELFNLTVYYV